jgi:hypothetical protein
MSSSSNWCNCDIVYKSRRKNKTYPSEVEENEYTGVFLSGIDDRKVHENSQGACSCSKRYPCFSLMTCVFMFYEYWVANFLSNNNKTDKNGMKLTSVIAFILILTCRK